MFKIKLLILLLITSFFYSCTELKKNNNKYKIKYIPGGIDGHIFSNNIRNSFEKLGIYSDQEDLIIDINLNHSRDLYITNINNTSNREKITSTVNLKIVDVNGCALFNKTYITSQFYVITSSQSFLSNSSAINDIKFQNGMEIINKIIPDLIYYEYSCNE